MTTPKDILNQWKLTVLRNARPSRNRELFSSMMRQHFSNIEVTDARMQRYDRDWDVIVGGYEK